MQGNVMLFARALNETVDRPRFELRYAAWRKPFSSFLGAVSDPAETALSGTTVDPLHLRQSPIHKQLNPRDIAGIFGC
jgi:hypothetical protein